SRTTTARTLVAGADAPLGHGHGRTCRDDPGRTRTLIARRLADELPPDEERRREDEHDDRDPRVQPQPEEMVGRIDPEQLLEEAADAVVGHVQGEERRPSEPEPLVDPQQDRNADRVVDELVEEGRMEGLVVEVALGPVLGADLQPPRQRGRLAEELLVEPVAPPSDPLGEEKARRDCVHEEPDALPGPVHHPRAGKHAEEDSAPDAEAALPDREGAPPGVRHLAPARDVVVETRPDDSGRDAPDRDPEDQIPVAAPADPAVA